MKKLSVKELVDFRRKSPKGKKTFVDNIKSNKIEVPTEGGEDYWISGLSAVCNSYRQNDINLVDSKIDELKQKLNNTRHNITRNMYQRNISILEKYKKMDSKLLRPNGKLSFLKKSSANRILTIKGLQIETKASHVYAFGKSGEEQIGAIWFVAKVNGYDIEEVGMFCDLLYRFLRHNFLKKYQISPKYCLAVDMFSGNTIAYSQIENGRVDQVFASTLDEINKLI